MHYIISGSHSAPAPPSTSPSQRDITVVQPGPPATSLDFASPASLDTSSFTTPRDTAAAALSHKPSWFASWTRTKGEGVPDPGVEKTRRPTPVPASGTGSSVSIETVHPQAHASSVSHQLPILSVTGNSQPVTQSTPTPTLPQDILVKPRLNNPPTASPRSASYLSSSSPAAQQSQSGSMSTPSPLDEDVPRPSATLLPSTHSAILQSSSASNSSPTPTNRFTLGIPLLGRTKVPLEKTVAAAQRDDIRTMSLPADQPLPCKQQSATQGLLRSPNTPSMMTKYVI